MKTHEALPVELVDTPEKLFGNFANIGVPESRVLHGEHEELDQGFGCTWA